MKIVLRSSIINLKNASHLITEVWWNGDQVMAKLEVLNTPSGKILKELVQGGVKLGISSRGLGSVNEDMSGNSVVAEDFQLICFDIVSEPSTPDAYIYPDNQPSSFAGDSFKVKMRENKQNQGLEKLTAYSFIPLLTRGPIKNILFQ